MAIYIKLTTENLVKHWFLTSQDMPPTENINKLFLPGGATELKIWDLAPRPVALSCAYAVVRI